MRDELKDHEEQEDMEMRENEDDAVCNVCRTFWKTYSIQRTEKGLYLTHVRWLSMSKMCTSRHRFRPWL